MMHLEKQRREEKAMQMKKRVSEKAKKAVVKLAKRTASLPRSEYSMSVS